MARLQGRPLRSRLACCLGQWARRRGDRRFVRHPIAAWWASSPRLGIFPSTASSPSRGRSTRPVCLPERLGTWPGWHRRSVRASAFRARTSVRRPTGRLDPIGWLASRSPTLGATIRQVPRWRSRPRVGPGRMRGRRSSPSNSQPWWPNSSRPTG